MSDKITARTRYVNRRLHDQYRLLGGLNKLPADHSRNDIEKMHVFRG